MKFDSSFVIIIMNYVYNYATYWNCVPTTRVKPQTFEGLPLPRNIFEISIDGQLVTASLLNLSCSGSHYSLGPMATLTPLPMWITFYGKERAHTQNLQVQSG